MPRWICGLLNWWKPAEPVSDFQKKIDAYVEAVRTGRIYLEENATYIRNLANEIVASEQDSKLIESRAKAAYEEGKEVEAETLFGRLQKEQVELIGKREKHQKALQNHKVALAEIDSFQIELIELQKTAKNQKIRVNLAEVRQKNIEFSDSSKRIFSELEAEANAAERMVEFNSDATEKEIETAVANEAFEQWKRNLK